MNNLSTEQTSPSREKDGILPHSFPVEALKDRLVMSKKASQRQQSITSPDACKQWQSPQQQFCTAPTLTESFPRTLHNRSNTRSPVCDPSQRILRTDTSLCYQLEKQAATSPTLARFRLHRADLQLQLRRSLPPYCTQALCHTEWSRYLANPKSVEENRRQTTKRMSWSFQKPSIDVYNGPINGSWDDVAWKSRQFSQSSNNHLSPISSQSILVNRCVNDVTRVCRGRIVAADFHDAQLENQTSDIFGKC